MEHLRQRGNASLRLTAAPTQSYCPSSPGGAPMPNIAEQLSDYAASLSFEDLPGESIHQAKRMIIDTLGCALGGYDSDPARIAPRHRRRRNQRPARDHPRQRPAHQPRPGSLRQRRRNTLPRLQRRLHQPGIGPSQRQHRRHPDRQRDWRLRRQVPDRIDGAGLRSLLPHLRHRGHQAQRLRPRDRGLHRQHPGRRPRPGVDEGTDGTGPEPWASPPTWPSTRPASAMFPCGRAAPMPTPAATPSSPPCWPNVV